MVDAFVHHDMPTYRVVLDDDQAVTTTSEHPFMVAGQGWTPVSELRKGDQLLRPDGTTVAICSIDATGDTATVHNFEVDGLHNYYVQAGTEWLLVHNAGCGAPRFVAGADGIIDTEAPALHQQISKVVDSLHTTGRPPAGVRQGGYEGEVGVWGNKRGDLDLHETGYYGESDVWPGPGKRGTERIVTGANGEVWYSPDHYGTFRPWSR